MEEILKRLGGLETAVAEVRATLPHLATKAEVQALNASINALESRMIKWVLGTVATTAGLMFTLAKFVN